MKGTRLYRGQYLLGDVIASGGFAVIYRAQEKGREEEVAIKLCDRHDDPLYMTSIKKEANLIQRFNHPNVVKLHPIVRADRADVFDAHAIELPNNPAFFVMEYLQGGTLEDYLRQVGFLTPAEALTIGLQVARGLDHIHQKEFAHNDLKLENIVFRTPITLGKPFMSVLVDFGVATRTMPPPAATPYITPPEQVAQVNLHIPPELSKPVDSAKVDVWGLGVVLYRMLGGRLPFDTRNQKTLTDRIMHSRPTSLQDLSENINPYLDELIIDGCLAKDPDDRLSLLQIGRELSRLVERDGEAVAQSGSKSAKRMNKWRVFKR